MLFVDLTGYTALSASLDPEEVYRFLRPGILALQRIVEGFGGTVPQVMGDGFMAVFGVPAAHEDDAERAVRAALAVRSHVAELNAGREGIRFPDVHAGVNSGEVMVAPSEESSGFAVIGDTVNTASRLADLAHAGRILVDERTRAGTAHAIRFGERRGRRAKGKAEPIATYEALGLRASATPRRGSSRVFVDRRDVMERVREELGTAQRSSRSRILVLTGEAGTGKSRFAAEVRRRRIGRVLIGRCPAFGHQLPLHALAEAIGSGLGVAPEAPREAVNEAARRIAPRVSASDRRGLSRDLRLLLGAERIVPGHARGSVHDAARAARIVIAALAWERPTIVVLDDFHWADADLVRLLRETERVPWPAPVLFLVLSRPTSGLRGLPRMDLGLLEAADMQAIARHVLGHELPDEARVGTLDRAGGNPLFLEETLGMLLEAGALAPGADGLAVADPERLRGVPSTIRLLIAARLDGLPPAEKALLQDAVTSGDTTWDRLLEHLGGPSAGGALRSLERRGLLLRRERSRLPGAAEYEVKHVLIREVAYESLPRAVRAARHLAIAAWLRGEAAKPAEEPVPLLAHHYERAWELARSRTGPQPAPETAALAVRYLQRWAERTFVYQARLAESIFDRALAIARASGDAVEPRTVADLLIGRTESLIEMGRHHEAAVDGAEASRIAEALHDRRRRARALLALGRVDADLGRMARARVRLAGARRLFHADHDLRGEAWTLHRISETWGVTDYAHELRDLEHSYRLFARTRDRWGRATVAQDVAYLLTIRGGPDFERWYERARRFSGDEADLRSRATLARTAGYIAFYRGELVEAIEVMREARPLAVQCGDRYAEADTVLIGALSEAAVGSPGTAVELADELLRLARELRSTRLRAIGLLAGARAALRFGEPTVASRRIAAARLAVERRQPMTKVEVHLVDGWVGLDRGAFSGVDGPAARVAAGARRFGWALLEPLPPLLRGRAALGLGELDAAAIDLSRAAAVARAAGATGTERLARLLAAQCRLLSGQEVAPQDTSGDPECEAVALENRGLAALRDGRLEQARSEFDAAGSRWELFGVTVWRARALRLAAGAARAGGDGRGAAALERRSDRILDRLRTPAADRAALRSISATIRLPTPRRSARRAAG